MDLRDARALYDQALARYSEALTRLQSGDPAPDLGRQVQELYNETLAAHATLAAAAEAQSARATDTGMQHEEPTTLAADPASSWAGEGNVVSEEASTTASPWSGPADAGAPAAPDPWAAPASTAYAPAEFSVDASDASLSDTAAHAPAFDLSDAPVVAIEVAAPAAIAADPPVLGRRRGLTRFSPPPPESAPEQPLRRDVLSALRTEKRSEIGKERKIAGNLPEWSPLPPGEILTAVRR